MERAAVDKVDNDKDMVADGWNTLILDESIECIQDAFNKFHLSRKCIPYFRKGINR